MYRILIVDDERKAREGLARTINWASLGIEVCATADSGEAALPLLEKHRPDILFTDVRMRRMDGIALSKAARQALPDIEIAFISGYSDSEFIRQALRLEAVDYVYKPVQLSEVESLMRRIVDKLDAKRDARIVELHRQQLLDDGLPLLRERFFQLWFDGLIQSGDEVWKKARELDIPLCDKRSYLPVVFSIDSAEMDESMAQVTMLEAIHISFPKALTCGTGQEIATILQSETRQPDNVIRDQLAVFLGRLSDDYEGIHASAGIGIATEDVERIPYGFHAARIALQKRFFALEGSVFFYSSDSSSLLTPLRTVKPPAMLTELLYCADSTSLRGCVADLFEQVRQYRDIDEARLFGVRLALTANDALCAHGIREEQSVTFIRDILEASTFDSIQKTCLDYIDKTCYSLDVANVGKNVSSVVREYIRDHLAEKITIEQISQAMHYSPAHLSMLYKKDTGETIGEAIINTRIRKAMQLLRDTDDLVYEIARLVGYPEQAHFTRLFKKVTGLTPGEYRRQAQ